jgi:hypothetical protein
MASVLPATDERQRAVMFDICSYIESDVVSGGKCNWRDSRFRWEASPKREGPARGTSPS